MELKDQVCTASQGRRLEELGVTMPAYFYHCVFCPDPLGEHSYYAICDTITPIPDGEAQGERIAPAYTCAELGEMLPCRIWIGDDMYSLSFLKADKNWHKVSIGTTTSYHYEYQLINSDNQIEVLGNQQCSGDTEAQARAAMLIYLLTHNLHTL